jgi:hypothetical protein
LGPDDLLGRSAPERRLGLACGCGIFSSFSATGPSRYSKPQPVAVALQLCPDIAELALHSLH